MKTLCVLHFCFPFFFTLLCFSSKISSAIDTLTPTQSINDSQTLVSSGEIFELGFFSPNNSKNRYVGIWYKKISIQTVVWVANRDKPLTDSSGAVLKISQEGKLVLLDKETKIIWSSNQSNAGNPVAKLLDSGNLVLKEESDNDPQNYLWQSFDYPTDTLLPGMKLGLNLKTGLNRFLTSWKSEVDPSSGDNFFRIDPHGSPQAFLFNRADKKYRSGPWNGVRFSGVPEMLLNHSVNFIFTFNSDEITYSFTQSNEIPFSRLMVNHDGVLQRFTWLESSNIWSRFWYAPKDQCDSYKECGGYGICDPNISPVCKCVQGFEPKNPQNWDLRDGSDGCVRKTKLQCQHGDGFLTLKNMKLPDTSLAFLNKTMSLKECEDECRKNCSCSAYANSNITEGGSGCVIWVGDLIDLRDYSEGGQDLYVRVASSELGKVGSTVSKSNSHKKTVIVGLTVGLIILLLGSSVYFIWNKKKKTIKSICKRKAEEEKGNKEKSRDLLLYDGIILGSQRDKGDENRKDDLELPLFDFGTIAIATNNFSDTNKLGQGGFGCVYKGKLAEGHDIAVKRLSKNSGQGIEEFKNEVNLIAKLQHRNLVRLVGCCIEGEERMLVYEYMQNKSLDSVIFDKEKSSLLNWPIRFHIIGGIARGLLYLHQDSRFRIIHRDLKASNVLLDDEMNPKISDFGMARIFGKDQINANTNRIVGTYGYMSPEYAMDGLFSVKSDVFSFGVLVLEIVSGMKNRGFYYSNHQLNLLGHAWGLWREGKGLELFDALISDSCSASEVLRCIQVGLLCVQEHAEDRPTMASVVLMLGSETASLPQPKNPGFCLGRSTIETDSSSSKQESFTVNHVTVTMPQGR